MGFVELVAKNLLRHKTRNLLTMFGIAASVAVLFSIISFNKGFERSLAREVNRTGIHFMIVPSGCAHEVASLVLHGAVIPKYLDMSVIDRIRKTETLEIISPLLVAQLPNAEKGRIDLIYGLEMSHINALKPSWVVEGRVPEADDEILMGSEAASHHGIRPGASISYPNINAVFRVAGIVRKTGSQDDAFIYMHIRKAQEILKKPSGATAVGIKVKDPRSLAEITEDLSEKVPGIQIVTMNQVVNSISNLAASGRVISLSIAFIAVFISAVGVMNSILMSVFERTQEIGMMRAIGASKGDIFRIIVKETIVLTLSGGIAGILLSAAGSRGIETFVRKFMPYVPGGNVVAFEPLLAFASLAFTFVIGVASGLYPAWKAARINPIEAIRG
ncbi:MAG TPA: FtsX-like permease family protein [Thermodesulfovibrionales bacterium]|nr:FtsX-like permease family protein [Thermodesulfovibrionales bacterium]